MRDILQWILGAPGAALVVCLISGSAVAGTRQKTDVVHLKNGDRITCEIKKLEYGQLSVKAPYTNGTFVIDWDQVDKIESPQDFVVETQQRVYYTGLVSTDTKKDDNVLVSAGTSTVSIPQAQVVRVGQFGAGFKDRIKIATDYGFSFARSNNQTQSTLHNSTDYRTPIHWVGGTIDSLFASQQDAEDTNRLQASAFYYRRISGSRWYGGTFGSFLTNNQQDLALRMTGGAGVLLNIISTNRSLLAAEAGSVYSVERFTVPEPEGEKVRSVEGSFGVRYSTFRFDSSEFIVNFTLFPSFTQPGRYRSTSDFNFYRKMFGDFYMRLGFFSNFDSRPPANTAKNDYGLTTSFGWSF